MLTMRISILLAILIGTMHFAQSQEWVSKMKDTTWNFHEVRGEFDRWMSTQDRSEKIPGRKQFDRISWFLEGRVDENGQFGNPAATWDVYQDVKRTMKQSKLQQVSNWVPVGPTIVPSQGGGLGRINCVAFHPTNNNIMYAGSASGGLWKTTNGGSNWTPMSDDLASLGVSDIVIDHQNANTLFVATGDNDANDTYSIGIIKSTDGGNTWTTTGLSYTIQEQRRISKLIMDPNNNQIMYAGTNIGLYKTTDGGVTWNKIRHGSVEDIELNPLNSNTIYIILGNRPYRSTNAGASFLPTTVSYTSSVDRAKLAVTPADTSYVYLLTSKNSDDSFEGLYLSTDGGSTYTKKSSSPNILGYSSTGAVGSGISWYAMALAVSPTNKNEVFAASVNIWKSTNAGASWAIKAHWYGAGGISYVHADVHELTYNENTNALWVCSDGGLDVTTDNGANWTQKNTGLMISQIYRLSVSDQDGHRVLTGWQDNGTHLKTQTGWSHELGGDGMECIISHVNYNYLYGESQYGNISRSTNGGISWSNISSSIGEEGHWVTPYVMHPTNQNILYAGYDNIYKTTDKGNTWTNLTNNTNTSYYKKYRALAISESDPNYLYASDYYDIYRSTDGGLTWTNCSGNLPSREISYITIHPDNPNIVYVTMLGFVNGEKVYVSRNKGTSWINISGNLPNIPANTLVFEKGSNGGIYVGTDVGVYYRDSTLANWIPFMDGLPNVIISELEINYAGHAIIAATYGRGLWSSDLYSWNVPVNEIPVSEKQQFNLFPNPNNGSFRIELNNLNETINNVEVYDNVGKLVYFIENANQNYVEIDLDHTLDVGIYHVKVTTDERVYSGKMIKK